MQFWNLEMKHNDVIEGLQLVSFFFSLFIILIVLISLLSVYLGSRGSWYQRHASQVVPRWQAPLHQRQNELVESLSVRWWWQGNQFVSKEGRDWSASVGVWRESVFLQSHWQWWYSHDSWLGMTLFITDNNYFFQMAVPSKWLTNCLKRQSCLIYQVESFRCLEVCQLVSHLAVDCIWLLFIYFCSHEKLTIKTSVIETQWWPISVINSSDKTKSSPYMSQVN